MRLSADWMTLADERILEYLDEEGPQTPTRLAADDRIGFSRPHINTRCQKLTRYGLAETLGNGVYRITDEGTQYLAGELDTRTLEKE